MKIHDSQGVEAEELEEGEEAEVEEEAGEDGHLESKTLVDAMTPFLPFSTFTFFDVLSSTDYYYISGCLMANRVGSKALQIHYNITNKHPLS